MVALVKTDPAESVLAALYGRQSKKKEASIEEQFDCGLAVLDEQDWRLFDKYRDGVSASRFSKKARPDWERLLEDLAAGRFHVMILWESSRGDRTMASWVALLEQCRTQAVRIYVITHERLYDPRNARDWKSLIDDGADSAYESEKTSERLGRHMAAHAMKGKPHGQVVYGYERLYDPVTRELVEQRAHPQTGHMPGEIMTKVAAAVPISAICRDLMDRGVPNPEGGSIWHRSSVRKIATNPAYIGKRSHHGKLYDATWPALVDEATYYAAVRVLSDPMRKKTKPGRAKYLLSYLITCDVCDGLVQARRKGNGAKTLIYACSSRGCVAIRADWVEEFITELLLKRLMQPGMYAAIAAGDDTEVVRAREQASSLRTQLDQFYDSAARPDGISADALARIEARLLPQIEEADQRAVAAATPPVLRQLLEPGVDVRQRWAAMAMAARRDVIGYLLRIRLCRVEDRHPGKRIEFDARRLIIDWAA